MIDKIEIKNYKCISEETIKGFPLTVITGLNSTGKSSVLQAVLLLNKMSTKNGAIYLSKLPSAFPTIRNRYENAKEIDIRLTVDGKKIRWHMMEDGSHTISGEDVGLEIERDLFYLSAERTGTEAISSVSSEAKCGTKGEFLLGTFEQEKSIPVIQELVKESSSFNCSSRRIATI